MFDAHKDIVRGIVLIPELGFATISNDESAKIWTMDGTLLHTLMGHTGFIFAIDYLPTGELVTGGDDCTVRLWNPMDGSAGQMFQLPRTVWSITHNALGDLIVACEDKSIRTFTRDAARAAAGAELQQYQSDCKEGAKPQGGGDGDGLDWANMKEYPTEVVGKIVGK